mmetsp:Transcript_11333/g.26647  ORF Transcript_11333/g.26647 Transcript_11333/m.26647 type:complete len:319 (+) Transcript_11333:108-1064(+)
MSSPTSVQYLRPRLESIAVSAPKTKRAKRITMPPEPEPIITCTNLQDLPDDLLAYALTFLPPEADRPLRTECAAVAVSQVSKSLRILALSNSMWVGICFTRWKTKVGFATRLARAEAESIKDTTDHTANPLIRGGFWYSKFVIEERDALRPTISRDELSAATFSLKLWFTSKHYPDMRRIKGALASGLDWRSLSDDTRFDLHSRKMFGASQPPNGTPFFINDDGSIINIKKSFETGTHRQFSLYVCRREDWGWELRSQAYVYRSVENGSVDGIWTDYSSSLIIEKRKKGIPFTRRGRGVKYNHREVPDIKEVKEFLEW